MRMNNFIIMIYKCSHLQLSLNTNIRIHNLYCINVVLIKLSTTNFHLTSIYPSLSLEIKPQMNIPQVQLSTRKSNQNQICT